MSIYTMTSRTAAGELYNLSQLNGKVTLIVNTASMCGMTNLNMQGLVGLSQIYSNNPGNPAYRRGGLTILAFPCAQFANQEPKAACDVAAWALQTYDARFQVMEKVNVKGPKADPIFAELTEALGKPTWNFTKYLVDKRGVPAYIHGPSTPPQSLVTDIDSLLME